MAATVAAVPLADTAAAVAADLGAGANSAPGPEGSADKAATELLPQCAAPASKEGGDGETPETGTPATRSLSPSSDGDGASPPTSDFYVAGDHRRGGAVVGALLEDGARDDAGAAQPAAAPANTEAPLAADEVTTAGAADGEAAGGRAGAAGDSGRRISRDGDKRDRDKKAASRNNNSNNNNANNSNNSKLPGRWPVARSAGAPGPGYPVPQPSPGPTMMTNSFSDRRIIEVLAAPEKVHRRLIRTAKRVPQILLDDKDHPLATSAELYGSLNLDMNMPNLLNWKGEKQDWASYYVNGRSDVDFVVDVSSRVKPAAVAERLLKKGPWRMVGQVQVHKFASTQFTLLGRFDDEDSEDEGEKEKEAGESEAAEASREDGEEAPKEPAQAPASAAGGEEGEESKLEPKSSEVYLDITCIENPTHFKRFRKRQEAFRGVFSEARAGVEGQFGAQGALAFDAYIHLLKAFAAKVPGNALTGYQATCIGLFTLQIGHFRLKPTHSIALSFFEGFLRFCLTFYGDSPANWTWNYRQFAIDLSMGGRWLPRMSTSWRSELYFMQAEEYMKTRPDERVNVAHSLEPARVCVEAYALLQRAFTGDQPSLLFGASSPAAAPAGAPTSASRT